MFPLIALAVSASLAVPPQESASPLPFSVERVRAALERAPADSRVRTDGPLFRVDVVQRVPDLLPPIDFNGGPVPPGGLYAYEQRQRLGSPSLGQPFITVDLLPIAHAVAHAVHEAVREHRQQAAREDVRRAIDEYCAARVADEPAICWASRER